MTARMFNVRVVVGMRDCLAAALAEAVTARPLTTDREASWQDRARDLLDAFDSVHGAEVYAARRDDLVSAAAEASERFGDDELERFAAEHPVRVYDQLLVAGFCITCGKAVTCDRVSGLWYHNRAAEVPAP